MKTLQISFQNSRAETLSARIDLPVHQHPVAWAIFAHCFTCSKNLSAVRNISRALNQQGIGVMRFDFTGLGDSEGDFETTGFSTNISDLVAAAEFLAAEFQAPAVLIGHSLGGAAVLHAARQIASVKAVITVGAPFDPAHVSKLFKSSLPEIEAEGRARVDIGGREFYIRKAFVDDLNAIDPEALLKDLRLPLLVMHSPQDATVGIENAAAIYRAAWHPKSFISLDGADHLLSQKADSVYVGNVIASWLVRYLDQPEKNELAGKNGVVVRTRNDSYTTDIMANGFAMTADEPESIGGNNFGPSPYEFVAAGLGACTSMTLQMYAKRKGWDLKEVTVNVSHNKDYKKDCDHCEGSAAKLDHFNRIIELQGELDDSQKKRLLEIADKCPVHKTLHSEVVVTTTLLPTEGTAK